VTADLSLEAICRKMQKLGAQRIILKPLANNDNSKQQIYLGSDFHVIRQIPSGNVRSAGVGKYGPVFKAPINLYWFSMDGTVELAKGSQLILYPKYPEVRLSGMVRGCCLAPSHLLQPPTKEERKAREGSTRYLILGVRKESVLAWVSAWKDFASLEATELINRGAISLATSVFYEYCLQPQQSTDSRTQLIHKLKEIYHNSPHSGRRLNAKGVLLDYKAQNGAGYTLEALFGITPNGHSSPDFMDWELKAHSSGPVTLMTPEPDSGSYRQDILAFMDSYATSTSESKKNFASRHNINIFNKKSGLTLRFEGYDKSSGQISDPDGGLMLRDSAGNLAAGWSFSKMIEIWKRKHANTCFVSYKRHPDINAYSYGPNILLATGTDLASYLNALANSIIYYDPGTNIKYVKKRQTWVPKKRNQFRVKEGDINTLYVAVEKINLED
jgi:hypothetical protein